jgi:TonB family protein
MARRTFGFVVFIIFICPSLVWAQESVQTAQALYASASYDEALAMLERLEKQPLAPGDAVELQQNRALCLLALGRTADAESALAAVVKADPTYRPADATMAPRVRTIFKDVRSKLLPGLVVSVYNDARAAYDQHQFAAALKGFRQAQSLVDDPDFPAAEAKSVQEYKVLADGFAKLADAAANPVVAPVAAPAPAPASTGSSAAGVAGSPVVSAPPVPSPTRDASASPAALDYTRVFDSNDTNVTAPVTLRQDMPRWVLQGQPIPRSGSLELIITADGVVERATLKQSMNPTFDHAVLEATKNWKYQPASIDGHNVRYRKLIRINFQ